MNDQSFYNTLIQKSMSFADLDTESCRTLLDSQEVELLPLLNSAYTIRKKFWGKDVFIHIIDNVQNGYCPEDCRYCAQSSTSKADIVRYPAKSHDEIMAEAALAYGRGAFRHCLVYSGYGPTHNHILDLVKIIKEIKSRFPMEVCVSPGVITKEQACILKETGLDRLNHNLNTSRRHYSKICTSHTYSQRLETIKAAKEAGLKICSGVIVGMGENSDDIIEMAKTLRDLKIESIPINFLIPIEGLALQNPAELTAEYCLRVLCLFRLLNPKADIRIAAGREIYFRDLEVMTLYPASSLFLSGYLNAQGAGDISTLRMIKDSGFSIKSDHKIDELIARVNHSNFSQDNSLPGLKLKGSAELHPAISKSKDGL